MRALGIEIDEKAYNIALVKTQSQKKEATPA